MNTSWHYIEDHYTGEIKIYRDMGSASTAFDPTRHYEPKPVIDGEAE